MQYAPRWRISHAKNTNQNAADFYKQSVNKQTRRWRVFEDYEKTLRNSNPWISTTCCWRRCVC